MFVVRGDLHILVLYFLIIYYSVLNGSHAYAYCLTKRSFPFPFMGDNMPRFSILLINQEFLLLHR
ncbi:hypothetical protein HMPREF6123_2203 [Oribacterium sinus F0268]|uniref:Uncharacterized protein n=1 Tax=Oribacterium sinus F0268 TaxID=585501 RepID=C2L0D4_9FIRM|nr:hypothetical protein HMPREF6123_2203 [Oribacterium sinus F0268]